MIATIILVLTAFAGTNAQQPYIGGETLLQKTTCILEVGISPLKLLKLQYQTKNCRDPFEDKENHDARCYHLCLEKQQGFYSSNGTFLTERMQKKWSFMRSAQLNMLLAQCNALNTYKDPCDSAYFMHKCFDSAAGDYPHGTKLLSIFNVKKTDEEACKKQANITDTELCKLESSETVSEKGKCYHYCLIEKQGYFNGLKVAEDLVRKTFAYVNGEKLKRVWGRCLREIKEESKCDDVYEIHMCLRVGLGEYPVPVDRFDKEYKEEDYSEENERAKVVLKKKEHVRNKMAKKELY